jgi:hypothetical protein
MRQTANDHFGKEYDDLDLDEKIQAIYIAYDKIDSEAQELQAL